MQYNNEWATINSGGRYFLSWLQKKVISKLLKEFAIACQLKGNLEHNQTGSSTTSYNKLISECYGNKERGSKIPLIFQELVL